MLSHLKKKKKKMYNCYQPATQLEALSIYDLANLPPHQLPNFQPNFYFPVLVSRCSISVYIWLIGETYLNRAWDTQLPQFPVLLTDQTSIVEWFND